MSAQRVVFASSLSGLVLAALCAGGCHAIRPRHTAAVHLGLFDFDDRGRELEAGAAYSGPDLFYGLRPSAGAAVATGGSVYAHAGVRWEIDVLAPVVLAPSVAVAAYERGGGKDLGSALEFRSGIEVGVRLEERLTVGVGIWHLSNAAIEDKNPGANSLLLSYGFTF
jgi:hypothetical protein